MKKIIITTGDFDGIGLEVTCKALQYIKIPTSTQIIVFVHSRGELKHLKLLSSKYEMVFVTSLTQALKLKTGRHQLIIIKNSQSPAIWVEEAAKCIYLNQAQALVTGPLSKTEIKRAGFKDIGHTDILKRITHTKTAYMAFIGKHFNVLLVTGHVPIHQVEKQLDKTKIRQAINLALLQSHKNKQKSVRVLGLNPHAGDQGLIGYFEQKILIPVLSEFKKKAFNVIGPMVPDVAFSRQLQKKTSFYVCLYHDQGLIPFKMVHGFDDGVHVTLGLPIFRCSVDHGTAKDIFGKNIANHRSMLKAIRYALKGVKNVSTGNF